MVIRTNGGALFVGSSEAVAKGQIYHHGVVKDSTIYVENDCFHTHGAIGNMTLKAGKAIADEGGLVYLVNAVAQEGKTVEIAEKSTGKFFIPEGTTQADVPTAIAAQANIAPKAGNTSDYSEAQKTGGNIYEIGNLSALEQYRDLVNAGFNFTGITVKLTADITLNDGWIPIGEGARKSGYANDGNAWTHAGSSFEGVFDGDGHTISNLNNKGFVPTSNRLGIDGSDHIYSYGFFGQSTTGAVVKKLTLKDVDIDTSRLGGNTYGDSVGAVIGFCAGGCELNEVSVYGSIKANEAVGGLIGRAYNQDGKAQYQDLKVLNCHNHANVECYGTYHAAGLIGYISNQSAKINNVSTNCLFDVLVSNCTVEGMIKTNDHDLSGLFNSAGNGRSHTVKNNTVDCQLVYTANSSSYVKWAANISSGGTITFGKETEANTKGADFSATVGGNDVTASIAEN